MKSVARQGQEIDDVFEADFDSSDRLGLITLASNVDAVRRGVWNDFEVLKQTGTQSVWKAVGSVTVGALDTRSVAEEIVQERQRVVERLKSASFELSAFGVDTPGKVLTVVRQSRKNANELLLGELKKAMVGWEEVSEQAVSLMKDALLDEGKLLRSA